MPRISSGLIIAGAYANKLRRVMFATLKGKADNKEIARASGELNATLFELFRDVGVDKGDVVRVTIEYEVQNGQIKWIWDTLEVQHFRIVAETEEKIKEKLKEILEKRAAPPPTPTVHVELEVEYLGTVREGIEDVYVVKMPKEEELITAGAVRVLFRNDEGEALAILVTPEGKAYKYSIKLEYSRDPLKLATKIKDELVNAFSQNLLEELDKEKAKEMIKELIRLE